MRNKKWLRSLLGVVLAALVVLRFFAKPAPDAAYYSNPRPEVLVIAHQGGDGVWPGDTLYAYEKAVALGADVLEMDAHITKDGEIVLMFQSKGGSSVRTDDVPDFDLEGIFKDLAVQDYDRAVELARGFQGEGPRAVATIAIARAILEPKKKSK